MNSIPQITYIYGLIDPRDNQLRYVGKSNNPILRYQKHVTEKDATHKSRWVQQLRKEGLLPWLLILDIVSLEEWERYEVDWIKCFRGQLTNIADGGHAPKPTPESRKRMSLAKVGKPALNKGTTHSVETKKKQSVAAKLRRERMTPEELNAFNKAIHRTRTSESYRHSGWNHSEEARSKISEANIGNKKTALLNRDQILEIRRLIASGNITQRNIAKMFGVSEQTICNIKNGRVYVEWK